MPKSERLKIDADFHELSERLKGYILFSDLEQYSPQFFKAPSDRSTSSVVYERYDYYENRLSEIIAKYDDKRYIKSKIKGFKNQIILLQKRIEKSGVSVDFHNDIDAEQAVESSLQDLVDFIDIQTETTSSNATKNDSQLTSSKQLTTRQKLLILHYLSEDKKFINYHELLCTKEKLYSFVGMLIGFNKDNIKKELLDLYKRISQVKNRPGGSERLVEDMEMVVEVFNDIKLFEISEKIKADLKKRNA